MSAYPQTALLVAGIIFAFIAFMHLLRIMKQWVITVGGKTIPMSVSKIGLVVSIILAVWMFIAWTNFPGY